MMFMAIIYRKIENDNNNFSETKNNTLKVAVTNYYIYLYVLIY